ncbi:MAG: hypothetical protein V4444_11130 [Pseudomonadota bacterium]
MQQTARTKAPTHLWIVGILSLIWNSFGGYDYTMTRTRNMDYLGGMGVDPNVVLDYIGAMPMYAQVGWGLGVWGGLLGSLLLLMRSRFAVHAFALSLIGAAVSLGSQFLGPVPPSEMSTGASKYMPLVIIALAVVQLWYANNARKSGVLS